MANSNSQKTIYFMGIGGTGMAAVAGLVQQAGHKVIGSDQGIYPPMSTMLEELGIPVMSPYSAENLKTTKPDLIVVANALSRGNKELEYALSENLAYTSFPKLLGDEFLSKKSSVVISGTHGKTTTSSLMAHVLSELGTEPSYMIGGIPNNFPRSFNLGTGAFFVIEGDEYDTAFFDKGPKFLHYHPRYLIVNNIEFDHADIYPNVEAIEAQFEKLMALVPDQGAIMVNVDDPGVARVMARHRDVDKRIVKVATLGHTQEADVSLGTITTITNGTDLPLWRSSVTTKTFGTVAIETQLTGKHNLANIAQVIATLAAMVERGELPRHIDATKIASAIKSFKGVKRRFDHLGSWQGTDVYEDFAHHPTAVRLVIEGFRQMFPNRRLLVAFEPRNATSRRSVFEKDYAVTLRLPDKVFIGACPEDPRIPTELRMNTDRLTAAVGPTAKSFQTNEACMLAIESELRRGDAVIFMSSGSFSGIQHQLAQKLPMLMQQKS